MLLEFMRFIESLFIGNISVYLRVYNLSHTRPFEYVKHIGKTEELNLV